MIRFAADNAFAVALRQIAANHGQGNDAEATHRRVGEMLRREGRHVDVNQLHNVTFLEVRDHLPPVDVLCPPPELLVHSIKLVQTSSWRMRWARWNSCRSTSSPVDSSSGMRIEVLCDKAGGVVVQVGPNRLSDVCSVPVASLATIDDAGGRR